MTIILDENLPHGLLRVLAPRSVTTVQQAGLAGVKNGALLAALESAYDVFLTGDKNLRYQQNLTGRRLAIIELPTNRWPALRPLCPQIMEAVDQCQPASYKGHRPRAREDVGLGVKIATLFEQSHRTYGSPRRVMALRRAGERCGRRRVARLMRGRGLHARQKRRFRPKTTDGHHLCPIAPNRLAGSPAPSGPDQIWATDITYVPTREGWLYVAGVLDLCSRKLVGWAAEDAMPTALVARAFERAVTHRRPPAGLLHHSDRGSQYASELTGNSYTLMEWLRA